MNHSVLFTVVVMLGTEPNAITLDGSRGVTGTDGVVSSSDDKLATATAHDGILFSTSQ